METNACPCGYFNSVLKPCACTPALINRYISKISGPLLDRIDVHIDVPEVDYRELTRDLSGESSRRIASRVSGAREQQSRRFAGSGIHCNAQIRPGQIQQACRLNRDCRRLIEAAMEKYGFSARAYDRILKISRTIADLAGCTEIDTTHLTEAIQYRSLDRNLWEYR